MTMMRTRLPVVATARKLQTNNWQQPIKNGCLKEIASRGLVNTCQQKLTIFKSHQLGITKGM